MRVDARHRRNHHRHHRRRASASNGSAADLAALCRNTSASPTHPSGRWTPESSKPTTPCGPRRRPRRCDPRVAEPRPIRSRWAATMTRRLTTKHKTWKEESSGTPTPTAQPQTRTDGSNRGRRLQTSQRRLPQVRKDAGGLRHTKTSERLPSYPRSRRETAPHRSPWDATSTRWSPPGISPTAPYPPILRTYTCVPGGSSRTEQASPHSATPTTPACPPTVATPPWTASTPDFDADKLNSTSTRLDWTITQIPHRQPGAFHPWSEPRSSYVDGFFTLTPSPPGYATSPHAPSTHLPRSSPVRRRCVAPTRSSNTATRQPEASDLGDQPPLPRHQGRGADKSTAVEGVRLDCVNSAGTTTLVPARVADVGSASPASRVRLQRNLHGGDRHTFPAATRPTSWGLIGVGEEVLPPQPRGARSNSVDLYHYRVGRHSIRVRRRQVRDFAHPCLVLAGWFKTESRSRPSARGAHAVDV